MNASKTAIIVDSGCDLPNDLIDKYDKLPKESLPNDNVVYSFVNLDTNLPN